MAYLYVGLAGIVGAIVRYLISFIWNPTNPSAFPWGTLACNFCGCLLLGYAAISLPARMDERLRLAVTTGFIGSFTTFSALSYETMLMLKDGSYGLAILYIIFSLWGGLLFAWFGHRFAVIRKNAADNLSGGNSK